MLFSRLPFQIQAKWGEGFKSVKRFCSVLPAYHISQHHLQSDCLKQKKLSQAFCLCCMHPHSAYKHSPCKNSSKHHPREEIPLPQLNCGATSNCLASESEVTHDGFPLSMFIFVWKRCFPHVSREVTFPKRYFRECSLL